MPLVTVLVKSEVPNVVREELLLKLRPIVASRLHVEENPEAHLTPNGVAVVVICPDEVPGMMAILTHSIEITIDANDYPERRAILEEAANGIWDDLASIAAIRNGLRSGSYSLGVWPNLVHAHWVDGFGQDRCPECGAYNSSTFATADSLSDAQRTCKKCGFEYKP